MMSAGDEPINIKKVQCLHSAVRGYAPLIFKLEKTSGCEDLLEKFEHVFNELKANKKLPYQMVCIESDCVIVFDYHVLYLLIFY